MSELHILTQSSIHHLCHHWPTRLLCKSMSKATIDIRNFQSLDTIVRYICHQINVVNVEFPVGLALSVHLAEKFDLRGGGVDTKTGDLSGGNMQKVVVAREFSFDTPVLIIAQPTRGVDIGAIEFIHKQIIDKRNQGCAILLVSADLDEIFRLSDRIITMFEGKVTGEFRSGEIDKMEISYYMTGHRDGEGGQNDN